MAGRLVSPTFVGRTQALAAAAEMQRRVESGRASHLLVAGEAGIGKTRFAEAVADRAGRRGSLVLRGGCVPLGSGEIPYAPIGEALRMLSRSLDPAALTAVLGADAPIVARIAPSLGPPTATSRAAPPETARARLFESLVGLLGRLAEAAPVLLIAEDLHWADTASLDTLSVLLRSLRDERVGLLLTFRSDELHRRHPLRPWLGEIERLDTVDRLELGALEPTETRSFIAAILGEDPSPALVDRIHHRSDGNPLFIEELLAQEAIRGRRSSLSPSLRDILLARVASVPDEAQAVLGVSAVAGRRIDADLLAAVAGMSPAALDRAIGACVDRQLLVVDDVEAGGNLAFRHALVQEVAYDGLAPGERLRLHRAVAEALAGRMTAIGPPEPGRWAEIAHHWDAARDEVRALDAAIRAAAEAEHAYAFASALAQYRRALAAWDLLPDPEAAAGLDHVELLSRAAAAAWLQGGEGQIPLLRAAIIEADRGADPVRGALLRGRLGFAQWASGDPPEARVAYREALSLMPPGPPTSERARALAYLAQALMLDGSAYESRRLCDAAIAMAREVGDRLIEGHALNTLGCLLADLGQGDVAAESMERALAIALEIGDPDEIGRAYHNATETLAICGRDERALELVREGIDRTTSMGMVATYGIFICLHGSVVACGLGRWDEATRLAEEGRFAGADPSSEVYALARTVELAVASGRWDDAATQLTRMDALLGRFDVEYQFTGPWSSAHAELALWQACPAQAVAAIEDGLARLERTDDVRYRIRLLRLGTRAAADLAEVARDRRDGVAETQAVDFAAALRARTAAAIARVADMDGGLAIELAAEVATVAAEESRLRGSSDPSAWHEAAERWFARVRPYHRGYARWREAEASLEHGDRAAAAEALRDACGAAASLGARPLHDAIAALARRARIPLDRQPQVGGRDASMTDHPGAAVAAELGLTPREVDVLDLVARGMTNRQIADTLFISVYTAGVHVSRILGKLGATSRTEAASKAYRLGLVSR